MTTYLWVKLIHIVSATLLFGTGLGTAFFMFRAWRSGDRQAIAATSKTVVIADWLFTAPAVVVQVLTGLWLVDYLNIAVESTWFIAVMALYVLVGACWLPVVWIQIQVRNRINAGMARETWEHLMKVWIALGVPAFLAVLVIFYLMVSRVGIYTA